jgi:hypothetical protein
MPLSAPTTREKLHTRTIVIDGYMRADGLFDIEARLTDVKTAAFSNHDRGVIEAGEPLHGMAMRMTIDAERNITSCEASTDYAPYAVCPQAAPNFSRLAGLQIKPGFLRDATARVAGVEGCTHLRELLQQMATTAYQTLYSKAARKRSGLGESNKALIGSCLAYAPDSPVVQRMQGERSARSAPPPGASSGETQSGFAANG